MVLASVGVAVLLGGVAAAAIVSSLGGGSPEDKAAQLVPADAIAYGTVFLEPSTDQKRAVRDLLQRVREAGADSSSIRGIERLVTDDWSDDYERYVKPSLGDQLAAYVVEPDDEVGAVFMAAITDAKRARAAVRHFMREDLDSAERLLTHSRSGVSYDVQTVEYLSSSEYPAAVVMDGFVVVGQQRHVVAAIDARGDRALADSDRYQEAREGVPDDVIAFAYLDSRAAIESLRERGAVSSAAGAALSTLLPSGPVGASLSAESDRLLLDLGIGGAKGSVLSMREATGFLETLPEDAGAAVSLGDLGSPLRAAVADGLEGAVPDLADDLADATGLNLQSDVVDWIGRVGGYLIGYGGDVADGAAVAETRSPTDSRRAVQGIVSRYAYEDFSNITPTDEGFRTGDGIEVAADEDRVIAGSGTPSFDRQRALDADGGFASSELRRKASGLLGGGWSPFLAVDGTPLRPILNTAFFGYGGDDTGVDSDYRSAVSQVDVLAGGYRLDGDAIRLRLAAKARGSGGADGRGE